MKRKLLKAEYLPLWFSMLVMWLTLFIYVAGPVRWIDKWDWAEAVTILLLALYFVAFAAGYLLRSRKLVKKEPISIDLTEHFNWKKFLSISIWINLFLTVSNAQIYSSTSDIISLFLQAIKGVFSPDTVYYGKDASSRMGNVVVWLTFFYSPAMYITWFLSVFKFKSLEKRERIVVVFTFAVELARWLSVGTNKGLFDIVLLFVTFFLVLCMHYLGRSDCKTEENRAFIKRITVIVLVAIILFFAFFGMALSARVNGQYNEANYASFPYNLIPKGLRFLIDKVDHYLVHGYNNMEKIIENCEFKWTFGLGNSRFSMQIVNILFDVDLTGRTYPYQLKEFGVDPLVSWHSAYSWFASDITFAGVIVLMFFAGFYLCGIAHDVIHKKDPVAMALLYLMVLMVVNASCTNYVLAYTNGFAGFWGLFVIRWLQYHDKVRNKLWDITKATCASCMELYHRIFDACVKYYSRIKDVCKPQIQRFCHYVQKVFLKILEYVSKKRQ